jgi:hypothetical protein
MTPRDRREKQTISFVMSIRLSVRVEQLGSHWTDFHEILIFENLSKICREYLHLISLTRIKGSLFEDFYASEVMTR